MQSSKDKILTSATECFFQHGYAAANISMIGRYAEISRVTIHKQFKSQEALFRAVVKKHMHDNNAFLAIYVHATGDFWTETKSFILNRCGGLFEEVSSGIVRTDLLHAGQSYCQVLIRENELKVRESIESRISKELADKRMTLAKIALSVAEFSRVIESAPMGLAVTSVDENNTEIVKQVMKVLKAATAI